MAAPPRSLHGERLDPFDLDDHGFGIEGANELYLLSGVFFRQLLIVQLEDIVLGLEHKPPAAVLDTVVRALFRCASRMPHRNHFVVRGV